MAQIQKGETFTDVSPGKSVTSTRLNNHVDGATVLPGAITEQTDLAAAIATADYYLVYDASAAGLKKVAAGDCLPPQIITARTDISTAIASDDELLFADTSASGALKKVLAQNILPAEAISAKTDLSATLALDDYVMVGDTSASNALKKATVASFQRAGEQLQAVADTETAMTTSTAAIPVDDTIPQNSEGTELLSVAITPAHASNILEIEAVIPIGWATGGANATAVAALFQDSTANGLAVTSHVFNFTAAGTMLVLRHRMTAGTTSATTFKIRVGITGGTLTFNGMTGARLFGGVSTAILTVREIKA